MSSFNDGATSLSALGLRRIGFMTAVVDDEGALVEGEKEFLDFFRIDPDTAGDRPQIFALISERRRDLDALARDEGARLRDVDAKTATGEPLLIDADISVLSEDPPRYLALVRDAAKYYGDDQRKLVAPPLAKLIADAPDVIWSAVYRNGEFVYEYLSHAVERVAGKPRDYIQADASRFERLVFPADREPYRAEFERFIESDEVQLKREFRVVTPHRGIRWLREVAVARRFEDGGVRFVGATTDATEEKRYEQRLKENEARYRDLINVAPIGLAIHVNGVVQFANPAAAEILGVYGPQELVGVDIFDFVHPDSLKTFKERLLDAFRQRKVIDGLEEKLVRADDIPIYAEISAVPAYYQGKPATQLLFRETTERKKVEERINLQSSAMISAANGIMIVAADGEIIWVNPAVCKLTGYSEDELVGQSPSILNGGEQDDAFYRAMWDTVRNGNVWKGELVNRRKDGGTYHEEMTITPVPDADGKINRFVAIKQDVTQRKNYERQLIEAKNRAEEASRLKSNLLANLSHEFRTPLNGIIGFSEILGDEVEDEDSRDMALRIYGSANRLLNTLSSILDLSYFESEKQRRQEKPIEVGNVLREIEEEYRPMAEEKSLEFNLLDRLDGTIVVGDPRLFKQGIGYMVDNAVKYTNEGSVRIEAESIEERGEPKCVVRIIDTGVGVAEEDRRVIFEEFRQASEGMGRTYEGAGLGLTLASKIVELMEGRIELTGELGEGSTFAVVLPAKRAEQATLAAAAETPNTEIRNGKRLLLVEDNEMNIELAEIYLKDRYEVHATTTAEDAVKMAARRRYDAVLMDINLGAGDDGVTAMKRIREIEGYESAPIVAVTGYAMPADEERFLEDGFTAYLPKPFKQRGLLQTIERCFETA
ncbi:MAG: PAS domain S-box protein [Ignavibacteriales bacterium]|nr:PAS domain S-box protein [Ignavibacteriales bacterium]